MSQFIAPHSIIALIFYALWALVLVLMVAADRMLLVIRGDTRANSFTPGVPHGSESYWRINRAHLNTVENLPIFAATVLSGWVVGMETLTFNRLAVIVVVARIIQSVIHIASGSVPAVTLRFAAYAVQIVCEIWMAALVLHQGGLF
ncbi:MAG TPA: MAPEG family protein [Rhizomicrobium sp.]|nr:MAPEG family protein [Rhizomicrobium sp.]